MTQTITPGVALTTLPTPATIDAAIATNVDFADGMITKRFNECVTNANNFIAQMTEYMSDLTDVIHSWEDPDLSIPLFITPISYDFDPGDAPEVPDIDLDWEHKPTMSTLIDVDVPSVNISVPTEELVSTDHVIAVANALHDPDHELCVAIEDKLTNDIQNGATGLGETIENDIWNRNYERDLQAYNDGLDRIAAEWSKRGFTLPDGVLANNINQADIEFTNKRLDTSRDIAIKQAEMALQNTQFSVQQGIAFDTMLRTFIDTVYGRLIAVVMALIDIAKAEAQIQGDIARTQLEYNKGLITQYSAELDAWKTEVTAEIDKTNTYLKRFDGQVNLYTALSNSQAAIAAVDVKAQESAIQQMINQANFYLQVAKVNLDASQADSMLRLEAAKSGGMMAAQLASGMFAGVSISANMHAQASMGEQFSRDVNFSETHSFSEDNS